MTEQQPGKCTVAVDLDGVLASYDGWKGIENFGDPIPGAREFIEALLSGGFRVIIHTTRTNAWVNRAEANGQDHLSVDGGFRWRRRLKMLVSNWLNQWGFPQEGPDFYVYDGPGKPAAIAYVDDQAVNCSPGKRDDPCFREIEYGLANAECLVLRDRVMALDAPGPDVNRNNPAAANAELLDLAATKASQVHGVAVPHDAMPGLKIFLEFCDHVEAMIASASKNTVPSADQYRQFEALSSALAARLGALDGANFRRRQLFAPPPVEPTLPGMEHLRSRERQEGTDPVGRQFQGSDEKLVIEGGDEIKRAVPPEAGHDS